MSIVQRIYAEPATNSYLRDLRGSHDLPHVYEFNAHTPGTPDIPELLPVGMKYRCDFGPDHCYRTESMVCGHSQYVCYQPEGDFKVWTVRCVPLWELELGRQPLPGWQNELVAVGGQVLHLFKSDNSRFTLLGMAPPEWYRPYLTLAAQERAQRIAEQAKNAQLALF